MKCTPSGHKWAHVSCVLWIPEVSIGCAEIMEPITKISAIPSSRWALHCVLCRNRKGACIQCSVKTCKTAYHVTCAFKYGLEMRAIIEDENADDGVKLRSYCQKHSVNSKKEKVAGSGEGEEEEKVERKRRKDMTSEEKTQARAARLHEIEREFDKHVSVKDISTHLLDVDQDSINYIYNYWKLKRRSGKNQPLLPPKSDDTEVLTHRQEQADIDKLKMFVQLRQDLERVRNLCYMVSRREKLSRSFFRMREQTFHKQVAVLSAAGTDLPPQELAAIIEANHGPSIYDRLYSHDNAPDHKNDFEELLARIAPSESGDEKKKDRNGLVKGAKSSNPYKKHYVNGSRRSGSIYSGLSSEESAPEIPRTSRVRKTIGSSTDDEGRRAGTSPKKKISPKGKGKRSPKKTERKKKKVPQSKPLIESSSDDESLNSRLKKDRSRSKTLQQMEKEMTAGKMGQSGTDSDDLMPIRPTMRNSKFPIDIYSDSSEDNKTEVKSEKSKTEKIKTEKDKQDKVTVEKSPSGNDSQQSLPRTKAAMKEFIPTQPEKKTTTTPEEPKPGPKKRGRKPSNKDKKLPPVKQESDDEAKNKENIKVSKQKDHPSELIVPQRQAAKKASENMRSTTVVKKDEPSPEQREQKQTSGDDTKSKPVVKPQKVKGKEIKDAPSSKIGRKKSKEVEKEPISYVPQRQAAKKAAAHIKSGLGTKAPAVENDTDKKKDEKPETSQAKSSPKKDKDETKSSKSAQKESSSSSSNSSSSSYSSSSSSEEEPEKPGIKPTAKAREIKPATATRQPSMFSPPGTRPTVDLPFLDRVSRPLSSTSASSDSDSSKVSDGSRSGSPYPKRPRRRRKGKSVSTDASPRKAPPDKKLKTSERRSECRVPSPTPEGEEPSRPSDARAATRARTRSTTSGGNLPSKSDARPRKLSKDEAHTAGPNKTPKESSQSSELPPAERKEDEEIKEAVKVEVKVDVKEELKTEVAVETPKNNVKVKANKLKRRSESNDDKEKVNKTIEIEVPALPKVSPKKSSEPKQKSITNRRMSVKEKTPKDRSLTNEVKELAKKDRRLSVAHSVASSDRTSTSPKKKTPQPRTEVEVPPVEAIDKKSPLHINTDYHDNDKHWLPKAPSPNAIPPPVEKPGGNEKYIDDKSMDSDYADKSSVKMIAKIQANLNENTMIKSPKTPMDARTITIEHMEAENGTRNMRKNSAEKRKFITQDRQDRQDSHVQGVEISKSAKIPSAVNPYPNSRSMFSPQSKDNEFLDFEMMAVDDGFNHDDIIKPFATYPEFFFKEDPKQGAQETLNLVDRLRFRLSTKKVPPENLDQEEPIIVNDDSDPKENEVNAPCNLVKAEENCSPHKKYTERSPAKESRQSVNHISRRPASIERDLPSGDTAMDAKEFQPIAMTSNEKWVNIPVSVSQLDTQSQSANDQKYDHSNSYSEDAKDPIINVTSVSQSEATESVSISKQSDDSQSLNVVDNSVDVELVQESTNYENNDLVHSDCAALASPHYVTQEKWRESKIATRRSSASSSNSDASVRSHKNATKTRMTAADHLRQSNVMPDIDTYPPIPAYSRPVEPSMPLNQYTTYPAEASPFLSSLPLFAGAAALPLPSPGPLYAVPYSAATPLPLKSTFYSAAFTSSSQNIALTTAMIAPPTPKPMDSPRDSGDYDPPGSDKIIHVVSSPSISVDSYDTNSNKATTASKNSNDSNEIIATLLPQESKSPPKVTSKATPKFPVKSPGKSPGISPKQSDAPKGSKRPSNRSNRSQRGRGRSKSRGQGFTVDYTGNSIQSKLVGTVYDFDEEIANDGVDLKALRDKRKSIDVRDDRKSEHSYKDASQSPRVLTPPPTKRPASDTKDVKPPVSPEPAEGNSSPSGSERGPGFSQVAPVLPGPVDMRTYHAFENPAPPTENAYHLLAFASGTAEQPLPEIDEEVEKQLHSALMASNPQTGSPTHQPSEPAAPPKEVFVPQLPKVSLSDSRNQLKVKIKGPFLDANYSASSSRAVSEVVPPPPAPVEASTSTMNPANAAGSSMSGSTNLRRMRKKELLRQYWTQDMNMDDPNHNANIGAVPPPAQPSPLTRAVITIPKAVASMTSIPTREDYKITDSPAEKKTKRKTTSGLSRELRHLEVSMNDDVDPSDDVKLSAIAGTSGQQAHKRRGRTTAKPNRANATSPVTPKLKIKLGTNTVQQVPAPTPATPEEPAGTTIYRPPKKRIIANKPSLEDLKRESMKYRKMVMADFEESEKTTFNRPKTERSEKRKKKKDKKAEKLQVVNSESDSATKLIIKIKRTKEEEQGAAGAAGAPGATGAPGAAAAAAGPTTSAAGAVAAPAAAEPPIDPFEYDPSAPDPLAIDPPSYSESTSAMRKVRTDKVTPIRLKLARSSEGSGYVMKEAGEGDARPAVPVNNNKHCEVR